MPPVRFNLNVPAETVVIPEYKLPAVNVSVPLPAFVIPNEPLITPPKLKTLASTVTVGEVVRVMLPVDCVRFCVPVYLNDAPICIALVMFMPETVASIIPPLIVKVPVPRAALLLTLRLLPELIVTPPLKVLEPESVSLPVPTPANVNNLEEPLMFELMEIPPELSM